MEIKLTKEEITGNYLYKKNEEEEDQISTFYSLPNNLPKRLHHHNIFNSFVISLKTLFCVY